MVWIKTRLKSIKKTNKYFLFLKIGSSPTAINAASVGNKLNGPIGLLLPIKESKIKGEDDNNKILKLGFLKDKSPITKKGKKM